MITIFFFPLFLGILLVSLTLPFFAHAQIMKALTVRLWLKALFAPFAVTTIYLLLSRWPQRSFTFLSDSLSEGLSLSLGALYLARLLDKYKTWMRVLLILIYVLVAWGILFFYSIYFVCFFFHECL